MTIDERLEALTQSLELLASLHKDLEKQTADGFAETRAQFAETRAQFAETRQFINQLAHIAEAHGQRLDRLEE
jgi:hypothetical protein